VLRVIRLESFGAFLCALTVLAGCGGSDLVLPSQPPTTPPPGAWRIEGVAGDDQIGIAGATLELPLSVKVTTEAGEPVAAVTVSWTAPSGGTVSAPTSTTNDQGIAQVLRTLGPTPGPYATQAEAAGLSGSPILFHATAMPTGFNQPPVAGNDEYNTIEGHNNTLQVSTADGVLQNDRDPEGGSLEAFNAGDPPNGAVKLETDGSFTYNPEIDFFGDDSFTYQARDPEGNSSTATVTIHVSPVNDRPGFNDRGDPREVHSDDGPQTVSDWARDITPGAANETDQILQFLVIGNSDPSLFTPAGQPAVTRDGPQSSEGTLTFTPSGGSGDATITVVLKDNGGTADGGADTSDPHTFKIRIRH
jgi:Bacterial Ig domain/Bacterial Ig-like domain (group 1)